MLSNPLLSSSAGSSPAASTSSARRSRIAFAYSVRFRRCMRVRPGRGFISAARSSDVSRNVARAPSVAASGRAAPTGGIMPARTFRMAFSQVSGPLGISAKSECSSERPPVRALSL